MSPDQLFFEWTQKYGIQERLACINFGPIAKKDQKLPKLTLSSYSAKFSQFQNLLIIYILKSYWKSFIIKIKSAIKMLLRTVFHLL